MAKLNLSGTQQAQLLYLNTLPPKFERIHRLVEEVANLQGGETTVKSLCRILDELRNQAVTLTLNSLADVFGMMSMVARRGGGMQMKVRALREGQASLKINFDGAMRAASTPEGKPGDEDDEED
ncbi:MAG TPA: hypothetical protein VJU15_02125 [Gemmatimonadales bacterium]|nr:hypothetical protein [Gemmatimonadales bacterium]